MKEGNKMKKIDKRKSYELIIDTETTMIYQDCEPKEKRGYKSIDDIFNAVEGSIQEYTWQGKTYYKALVTKTATPLIFDLGYTIKDKKGNVMLERSFLVREVFLNMDLMKQAYYFKKYPLYVEDLARYNGFENGKGYDLTSWGVIMNTLREDMKAYKIKNYYAYNMKFDNNVINSTDTWLRNSEIDSCISFLEDKIPTCLWKMAQATICDTMAYKEWAKENDFMTAHATPKAKTGAEVVYRYLTNNIEFIEEHTALSDSRIEKDILQYIEDNYSVNEIKKLKKLCKI